MDGHSETETLSYPKQTQENNKSPWDKLIFAYLLSTNAKISTTL